MKNRSLRLWLACAAVFLFGAILRICTYTVQENSMDGFYHMRIARQGWSVYARNVFPTTTLSSWEECFADKELLYHVLLSGVDSVRAWLGLPDFPFHFGALFFFGLVCAAFALCTQAVKLKHPEYPMLLFTILTALFFTRMLMLRAHTLAVVLMLLACTIYAKSPRRYLPAGSFLIGALFAWGYSNPHFVFLAAGGFAFGFFWTDRSRSWKLLAWTALGLAAGFIIHPQFPNNCINWYVQCIVVPGVMSGEILGVILGSELRLSGLDLWHFLWPVFLLQLAALGLMLRLFLHARKKLLEPVMLAVGSLFLVTATGMLFAMRFVEYAQPFSVLYFAMLLERVLPEETVWRRGQCVLYGLLILCCGGLCVRHFYPAQLDFRPVEDLAAYVRSQKIPANTVIANHEWDMFPALYYSLPEYRFLCGLDPCFALVVEPQRTMKIEAQRWNSGQTLFSPADFADVVHARLLYVRGQELYERLFRNGYDKYLLYRGKDGYLFYLPQHGAVSGE